MHAHNDQVKPALSITRKDICSSPFFNSNAADAGSILRCGKGFFFQGQLSTFSADSLTVSVHPRTESRVYTVIYICAHVKDPVIHVKVRWIMETRKHPACTVGWVARLCCSWLSPGNATRISHGREKKKVK